MGVLCLWGPEPQILPPPGLFPASAPPREQTHVAGTEDRMGLRGPGAGHGAKASCYISPRAPRGVSEVAHSLLATIC